MLGSPCAGSTPVGSERIRSPTAGHETVKAVSTETVKTVVQRHDVLASFLKTRAEGSGLSGSSPDASAARNAASAHGTGNPGASSGFPSATTCSRRFAEEEKGAC